MAVPIKVDLSKVSDKDSSDSDLQELLDRQISNICNINRDFIKFYKVVFFYSHLTLNEDNCLLSCGVHESHALGV